MGICRVLLGSCCHGWGSAISSSAAVLLKLCIPGATSSLFLLVLPWPQPRKPAWLEGSPRPIILAAFVGAPGPQTMACGLILLLFGWKRFPLLPSLPSSTAHLRASADVLQASTTMSPAPGFVSRLPRCLPERFSFLTIALGPVARWHSVQRPGTLRGSRFH